MALSLYRKYRPATFSDVVGQDHIETTLKNAVQTGSVSHAYLFCGPRGTGKTTTARLLAKALLCEKAPTEQPDGTCLECQEIASGVHPDVYELDAASRTGVDNVREEIIGRVQFSPTRGSYKIYIIDEVHMLSTAAFNALLKIIEEPPSHVIFVLCTTDSHKVPETIKSRCQQFEFHRLSEESITARLRYICDEEVFSAEPEALSLIAQRSQGGMRDAISSLEQVAVFTNGKITFDATESLLGEVSAEQLFSVSTLLAERNVAGCFAWVASFTQSGTDIAQFARDLSSHIRNVYIASVISSADKINALLEIIPADEEAISRYIEQANQFASSDRLAHILLVLGELSTQLRYSANARLALEIALTRIARPQSDLSLESLAARIAVLESSHSAFADKAAFDASSGASEPTKRALAAASEESGATRTVLAAPSDTVEATGRKVDTDGKEVIGKTLAASNRPADADRAIDEALVAPDETLSGASNKPNNQYPAELDAGGAHRLWAQVIKDLQAQKKFALTTLLGGSLAHVDPKTKGLCIELPKRASFALQNIERAENKDLVIGAIQKVHGTTLPLSYKLGTFEDTSSPSLTGKSSVDPASNDSASLFQECQSDETIDDANSIQSMLSATFGTQISVDTIEQND